MCVYVWFYEFCSPRERWTFERSVIHNGSVCLTICPVLTASFSLPEEGVLFDSIEYVEQELEATKELVEKYNKEGKDNLPPPQKRSKFSDNRHGKKHIVSLNILLKMLKLNVKV